MSTDCQRKPLAGDLLTARGRRALDQLRERGWALGPPTDPEGWRRQVRSEARRTALKVRTGTAVAPAGEVRPWAIAVAADQVQAVVALMGFNVQRIGAALVAQWAV